MTNSERNQIAIDTFLKLVKEAEEKQKELKYVKASLSDCMRELPLGSMFQDPSDSIVYQIIAPAGTFVEYKNIDYIRTRREGEKAGSLSMKAAQEAGFKLKEEEKK